jgi:hypothetical protein
MAIATKALALVETKPSPQSEITSLLNARENAKATLFALDEDVRKLTADTAQQLITQALGASKIDADAVLAQYKAAQAKQVQLAEMKVAVGFLLQALDARADELKLSSPAEFIIALKMRITEQQKASTKTKEDAKQAQAALDDLNKELAAIAVPAAESGATATPAGGAATTASPPTTGTAAPAAVAAPTTAGAKSSTKL